MNKLKHIAVLITLAFLCPCFSMFAQNKQNPDSLLLFAGKVMYTDPENAVKKSLQVYEMAEVSTEQKISALILISNAYFSVKNNKEAKKYAFIALTLAQKNNDYVNQVKIYGLVGNHYQVLRVNQKARFYLSKAEDIMQQHALPDDMRYLKGNIFAVKGNSYKNDLDCDFAITYFDKAIYELKRAKNTSAVNNLNMVLVQKGFCLLDKQMPNEAASIFSDVLKTASAQKVYDIWVYAKIGMARSFLIKKDYQQAVALLKEALAKTESNDKVSIRHELYRNLSEGYLKLNDGVNYRLYNTLYHTTFNEVNSIETTTFNLLINEISKDAEVKITDARNAAKSYAFMGIPLVFILLFIPLVILYKKQKKVNNLKKVLFRKTLNH